VGNGAVLVENCLDPSDGNALDIDAEGVSLDNVTVTTAPGMGGGGAIKVFADDFTITNSTIVDNLNCFTPGGGISSIGNDFTVVNTTIAGNAAYVGGGANGGIFLVDGSLDLTYSDVVRTRSVAPNPSCV
jgi:hypothetical protein